MNQEIPIFFTVDDQYAPFLAVSLRSAILNANPSRQYCAFVLHQGLTPEHEAKLKAMETSFFRIRLLAMQANFDMLDDRMSNRLRCDYFTLTIYFRLFIPAMFPEYDKGIYLDSDTVLCDDLANLFDIPLGDHLIGACEDTSIANIPPLVAYTQNAVGMERGKYVNSGVLLMDLKKLREKDLEGHFLKLLNTYHFDSIAPDQDYLNAMCSGRILYLDRSWDTMPDDAVPPLEHPSLIHYNLFSKPWCYDGIQYENEFWKYAKDSGFLEEILAYKAAYSPEQKESDRACLERLVQRGEEIPQGEITFRKLYEKGVKIRL